MKVTPNMSNTSRSSQSAPRQRSYTERTSRADALVERHLDPEIGLPAQRSQLVDHLERTLGIAIVHRGHVGEVVVLLARRVLAARRERRASGPGSRRRWSGRRRPGGARWRRRTGSGARQRRGKGDVMGRSGRSLVRLEARSAYRNVMRIWFAEPNSRRARSARLPAQAAGRDPEGPTSFSSRSVSSEIVSPRIFFCSRRIPYISPSGRGGQPGT